MAVKVNGNKLGNPTKNSSEFDGYLEGEKATGEVSVYHSHPDNEGGDKLVKQENHELSTVSFSNPELLCRVTVSGGHTINLGNYESAKIMVGVTIPCYKEDLEDTYDFASDWVTTKLGDALKDNSPEN